LAALIAGVLLLSVFGALWPRGGGARVEASPTIPSTTAAPTTTTRPKPVHPFEAADAIVSDVALYDAPGATEPVDSMSNPTSEQVPLAFLVKEHGPAGWLQVQISRRPNGSTAWIHASDVSLRGVDNRIVVEREAHQLTVYRGMTDQILFQTTVADGAPATPTPLGDFFVDVVVKVDHPSGAYGPYQLSVAGFSDVLQSFGGGPGQIAIHGTNHPELIGRFVSNGCVRLTNDDITTVESMAPVGTPVQIVA
jgi:lipoprotein-anchoring transpeptidase ErfK/SrfK